MPSSTASAHRLRVPVLAVLLASGVTHAAGCGQSTDAPLNAAAASQQTLCQSYCAFISVNCYAANLQYPSFDACLTSCASFAPGTDPNAPSGNTLACRYLFAVAAENDAMTVPFCRNAGPTGGGACTN